LAIAEIAYLAASADRIRRTEHPEREERNGTGQYSDAGLVLMSERAPFDG
jgi:hypothetical protein